MPRTLAAVAPGVPGDDEPRIVPNLGLFDKKCLHPDGGSGTMRIRKAADSSGVPPEVNRRSVPFSALRQPIPMSSPPTPNPESRPARPLIGVTMDLVEDQARLRRPYLRAIEAAGGIGVPIAPIPGTGRPMLERLDALIFSGGDDPDTTTFGDPVHPKATLVAPDRQAFELELLDLLDTVHTDLPVLGICLGMQLMGLHAGGRLDQHLPDRLETAADHWNGARHFVSGDISGTVFSHHRQALVEPGRFRVTAVSPDGVIEAIEDPDRPFRLGVQWHPERTDDPATGKAIFERLVRATGGRG